MENLSSSKDSYLLPDNYEFISVLGQGCFGEVIKCIKLDTNEEVAVKIPLHPDKFDLKEEASIMRNLMDHNLDEFNIIKYNGELLVDNMLSLEYEFLDISLYGYMNDSGNHKMALEDIRSIIQQMAVALEALRRVKVIHTDVKLDNIMVVDRTEWPLRVKLIDFGLAINRETAEQGETVQPLELRAPEIILALPFSESIDIWALGIVMALMMFETYLFPGDDEYDVFLYMLELLGPPPQHLLNNGWKSQEFFKKTSDGSWILKTSEEYYGLETDMKERRHYKFRSFDEMKKHKKKGAEWMECVELLKAMLQWEEKDRITPCGILRHPFISKSYLKYRPSIEPLYMDPSGRKRDEEIKRKNETIKKKDEEIKRKDDEIKRKDEVIKMRNKQIKKKDEEIKRILEETKKDEEIKRKDEEIKRKDEEIKRKDEEIKRKDEEIKRKNEVIRRRNKLIKKDEEIKRKDEEIKRRVEEMKKDEEIKRKDEEMKRMAEGIKKDEEIKRKDEEIKRKDEEMKRMAEEMKKDEEIKRKDEEMKRMAEEMKRMAEELKKDEEIKRKDEEIKRMADEMKRMAEEIKKEEEIKRKDEEMKKDKTIKRMSETIKKKDEEMKRMDEEMKRMDEEMKRMAEEIEKKDEEIMRRKKSFFGRLWSRIRKKCT